MNIKTLILQGEGERLDFKNKISNAGKIAKTLVAFANHKGGKLLVGVADNGAIKGVKSEDEEKYMLYQAATLYCRPIIEPRFEEVYIDDKIVLIVDIPESNTKPHYALSDDHKWWVYVRVKDKSVLAGKVVVDVLKRKNKVEGVFISYSEKEKNLLQYLEQNERAILPELCKHLMMSRRKTQQLLVNLILSGNIRVHFNEREEFYTAEPLAS
ncbi:Putative DNA-binding domain-containing protein [bacterium A37T11]|nr:Putative DNA-binding domain-containing protein [bacterium A37T11]